MAGHRLVVDDQRQAHIFGRGKRGQQVVELEDETHLVPAQLGELVVVQPRERLPVQIYFARGGVIQPAQQVQQGGFARAGGSHDGDELAALNAEIDAIQRGDCDLPHLVGLG